MSTQILYTRKFRETFLRCLFRRPRTLRIAVPYIGGKLPLPNCRTIVELTIHVLAQGCKEFQLITEPPSGNGGRTLRPPDADIMSVQEGFNLMIHKNNLHSKVYQFVFPEGDRAAFVGSANLSSGGLENNAETVAFFSEKEDNCTMGDKIDPVAAQSNDAVAVELDRLADQAFAYPAWKIHNSQEKK